MIKSLLPLAAVTAALPILFSCTQKPAQAAASHSLAFDALPVGLEALALPKVEGFTEAKAALGKKLFFDKRLSSDGSMSCQSCHYHDKGWTDGVQFSTKVDGTMNTRNSPTLYNLVWHERLYWDGRAPSLEANIGAAWKGHMGGSAEVVAAINKVEGYKKEFQAAFGAEASIDNVPQALSMFVRTLRAGDSKYDRKELSADAEAGRKIFFETANCIVCHTPPLFTDRVYHNVGAGEKEDVGRGKIDPKMKGAFKTPTMRNVAKSAPYFHDGSVKTLEEAVRFMVNGGKANPNLDPLLKKVDLTDTQINQLVAFLESLSSEEKFVQPELPK